MRRIRPHFDWKKEAITQLLADVRYKQGKLVGRMESLGFNLQAEATLQTLTLDVLKSSEIEGEILDPNQVRSSIARRLGIDIAGLVPADRNVEGVVEMMLDATQNYSKPLSSDRLFGWHAVLFPTGRSGMHKIVVGSWRNNTKDDPMQVVSGPMGRKKVHFQAPDADKLDQEMTRFIEWFNTTNDIDDVLKAAIAHLWFVTIHPFDDGNGRIARAITDMQLSRADQSVQRFYSMSAQIRVERNGYYSVLEKTQKDDLDITEWLTWFLNCLDHALSATDKTLEKVIQKARFWENPKTHTVNDRQKKLLNMLLDGFQGKLSSSKWATIAKCSQDTASRDIQDLIEKGILLKVPAGGRSTSYILNESIH
ncbi:Fic family protein [Pseudobacter ginsenosidimutans]|uniref:Fic family protein n=1 Tax=Pseudobacter ginsenosidimutans TaxID=661488 RepID=A0A4Q7MQ95_9BACT|nr:Fic family protein [Pseudobacter ginsenosidimutans]QEC42290.1 Fic family protein [Pseudobacter ginsenosidimutans]RZS70865.1 Fic family protein [Pseudobacter ginsenosidimutans]